MHDVQLWQKMDLYAKSKVSKGVTQETTVQSKKGVANREANEGEKLRRKKVTPRGMSCQRMAHPALGQAEGGVGRFWTAPKILLQELFLLSLCHSTKKTVHAYLGSECVRKQKETNSMFNEINGYLCTSKNNLCL